MKKKNLTTTFIQLLRTKTIKKNKIMKKEEKKSYLDVVANEAKEREKIRKAY